MAHRSRTAPASDRPRMPIGLVIVWCVLAVPALLAVVVCVGQAFGNPPDLHGMEYVVAGLVSVAVLSAAVAATAAARHARRRSARTALAVLTTALLLVLAVPVAWAVAGAATEEWCEGQPGGRGGTGYRTEADVPPLCR